MPHLSRHPDNLRAGEPLVKGSAIVHILERLANGPATIGQLAAPFGLTLNGLKKHVGILEEVDLVKTTKVGRSRECQLGPAELQDVTGWIDSYRRALERRLDGFATYVESRTASGG